MLFVPSVTVCSALVTLCLLKNVLEKSRLFRITCVAQPQLHPLTSESSGRLSLPGLLPLLPAFHILPSPTVCHITHALARRTKLYINSFNLERKRFFEFSVSLFRKSTALVYSIMPNFPDYAESDDTPQVQVGEEEQHLPQPLPHTSGR